MKKTFLHHKAGQLLLEALCLILFSCAFLALLSHLYEKGKKEIHISRGGKYTNPQNYKDKLQN